MRPSFTPSRLFTGDFGGLPDFDVLPELELFTGDFGGVPDFDELPDLELFGVLLPRLEDAVDDSLLLVFAPLEAFDAGEIMSSKSYPRAARNSRRAFWRAGWLIAFEFLGLCFEFRAMAADD